MSSNVLNSNIKTGFYDVLDHYWGPNSTTTCSSPSADLIILGHKYTLSPEANAPSSSENLDTEILINKDQLIDNVDSDTMKTDTSYDTTSTLNNFKAFFNKITINPHSNTKNNDGNSLSTIDLPENFLNDLNAKFWFTYRSGFPLIERDKNGPSPLSFGSILRGTLDIGNINKGFTTDSGWGCMIRTSQSLLANTLLFLELGRSWNLNNVSSTDLKKHWDIVEQFADTPSASFSIHNYVLSAAKYCGKKPGEWFGPSNAAKSIQKMCDESVKKLDLDLNVYISTDSGDIFEDEVLKLGKNDSSDKFTPILILCGVRLGVKNINPIYWEFLKLCLEIKYSVGIAGGRPSSSHYFFGYQSNDLFYFDPHLAQNAILLNESGHIDESQKINIFDSIHTTKLKKIGISNIDPSMLIGFLIKSSSEYNDFKSTVNNFDNSKRFLNIYESRPQIKSRNSTCSELDGFIDLGVESLNDEDICCSEDEDGTKNKEDTKISLDDEANGGIIIPINGIEEPAVSIEKYSVGHLSEEFESKLNMKIVKDTMDGNGMVKKAGSSGNDSDEIGNEVMVIVSEDDPNELVVVDDPDVAETVDPVSEIS